MMKTEEIMEQLTVEEKAALCSGYDFWHTKSMKKFGLEPVMMCDGPHGLRKQIGEGDHLGINESIETVCYPTASALAASFDRDVMKRLGTALGQECKSEKVGMLLGPGINMKRSPLCGRNFEYFSEDPYVAGEMGTAYVLSLQEQGIAACVKHFAANNQETRRMSGSSNVDERTLRELYLAAFENVVKNGKVRSVMCAYNAINGTFCAENKKLLKDILRKEWGFDGMVVTDWGAIKNRVNGIKAGVDLEMPGNPNVDKDGELIQAIEAGELSMEEFEEAVGNVVSFIRESNTALKETIVINREDNAGLSEELSGECAVLLKNESILPLPKRAKVAFIGEFAENPRYQGAGSSHINVVHPISAVQAAEREALSVTYTMGYCVHGEKTEEDLLPEAVQAAENAEYAVIFAGLPNAYESEGGDRTNLKLPENQNRLIEEVVKVQPNTIVVLHGGAPMELPWVQQVPAILCMYLGGQNVGAAAVSLLFGDKNPSGKLAETWPLRLEDNPSYLNFPGEDGSVDYREGIFIGYRYYDKKKLPVLFPFGHGLSYTEFAYSNLKLDKTSMTDTETVEISCDVKNIGTCRGKEVVQLYVSDKVSTVNRPIRELKEFEKVSLEPGETKTISFTLDKRAFAYYETKMKDWFVESGAFEIEIGSSSRSIHLQQTINVQGTVEIPMTYTYNSTIGDLQKSTKGRAFLEKMRAGMHSDTDKADNLKNMGEGSEQMAANMMMEMPLQSLISFGRMTVEQLDGLLTMLNEGGAL